jgi:uncharacterized membrane protein YphA (DoxX/SURF4 family)
MLTPIYNDAVGLLLLRTVTGILFFFQGYDKLINVKTVNVVRTFSPVMSGIRLPVSILTPLVAISSMIELVGGALLFLGLFKTIALYSLAGDMIFVAFAFSSFKAMWDMQYYFPRMLFLVLLLFAPPASDIFSLDMCFFK